ncbi:MAG: phage protein [Candidatus Thiodiazotropha sp. (ex Monitilora ramsayi)]|nr:phage protein [Candidatus Thiodiazotropha sp. (ex Monitilora ramsayi)]
MNEASELLCRSARSLRRWKHDTPQCVIDYLLIRAGFLGAISNDWDGWRLFNGELITPNGYTLKPGEITAIPYQYALVAEYRRILREQPHSQDIPFENVIPLHR